MADSTEDDPLDHPDPVHTLTGRMIERGDRPRLVGLSLLGEAIAVLRLRAGESPAQIERHVQTILRSILKAQGEIPPRR